MSILKISTSGGNLLFLKDEFLMDFFDDYVHLITLCLVCFPLKTSRDCTHEMKPSKNRENFHMNLIRITFIFVYNLLIWIFSITYKHIFIQL